MANNDEQPLLALRQANKFFTLHVNHIKNKELKMKKCKITVVGAYFLDDLVNQYGSPALGPCELHTVGQVFYSNGWQKPKGMCDNAWKSMLEYVMTLSHGGRNIFNGGWVNDEKIAIVCCNDGLRPVSFKIEATDEEAEVFSNL